MDPVVCFLEVDKTSVDIFGITLTRFLQEILGSEDQLFRRTFLQST